ncbi:hypothetical protein PMAYCL1PPCAC_33212, partial [Pristionchus mayeri]
YPMDVQANYDSSYSYVKAEAGRGLVTGSVVENSSGRLAAQQQIAFTSSMLHSFSQQRSARLTRLILPLNFLGWASMHDSQTNLANCIKRLPQKRCIFQELTASSLSPDAVATRTSSRRQVRREDITVGGEVLPG